MRTLIAIAFAVLIAFVYSACTPRQITNPLEGIEQANHALSFLLGGTVKYNLTQVLYEGQNLTISVVRNATVPVVAGGDACDFDSTTTNTYWTDTTNPSTCNREVVSAIPFQNFQACSGLLKGSVQIGAYPYDTYSGAFAATIKNPVGQVLGVDVIKTTIIKKRFTIKLQKAITLTADLNITQPLDVFSAGATLQDFDYNTNTIQIHWFTAQNTDPSYGFTNTGSATGSHTATVTRFGQPGYTSAPAEAACPAGVPNCIQWLLTIDPTSGTAECSFNNQNYVATLTIACGGCLIEGNTVDITHIVSLTDYCDIVDLQFDITGTMTFYSDAGRTTVLTGPISIDTDVYVRVTLDTTFAPMVTAQLDTFTFCNKMVESSSYRCRDDFGDNAVDLVAGNTITTIGTTMQVAPNPISSITITPGNNVVIDFSFRIVFSTGAVTQTYLNTASGRLQFDTTWSVTYHTKKRSTMSISADPTTEESFSLPAPTVAISPDAFNQEKTNSAATNGAAWLVVVALIALLF